MTEGYWAGPLGVLACVMLVATVLHAPPIASGTVGAAAPPDTMPPTANAGPNQTVGQNVLVTFDGSGSTDNVGIVNYTWTLPSVPGVPRTILNLTVGGSLAAFDPVRPILYVLGSQLYFVNLTSGLVDHTFGFGHNATYPMSLDVSPKGTYLAVGIPTGSRGYYDFGPYASYIAGFDLTKSTKLGEFFIDNDLYRILATSDGHAIVAGGSGQWAPLQIWSLLDGTESAGSGIIWQYSDIRMHPNETRIYSVDQDGIYPPSVHRYDFTPTGGFSSWIDWPYFGTYPGGEIWVSPGGDLLVCANGMVLALTDSASTDMQEVNLLPVSGIGSAAFSPSLGLFAVTAGTTVSFFDYRTFAPLGSRDLGGAPTTMTFRGNDLYALVGNRLLAVRAPRLHLYGVTPTYRFPDAGTYVVTLTVWDAAGNSGSDNVTITVLDTTPPVADPGVNMTVAVGTVVTLYGNGSTDNVGIVSYVWTFTDGGPRVLYGPTPTYQFSNLGTFVITLTVQDGAGNTASANVTVVVKDLTPPTTLAVAVGVSGANGWFRSEVTVYLNATDTTSGVAASYDSVDLGAWRTYTGPFQITSQGEHTVGYYSVDTAGNIEPPLTLAVNIDWTPPVATPSVQGTQGSSGWMTSTPVVFLQSTDSLSGVGAIYYRVDTGTWGTYSAPFSLGEGIHTVGYFAVDAAGNAAAAQSIVVRVDTQPPYFVGPASLGTLTTSRVTIEWTARDDVSGIADIRVSLDGGAYLDVGNDSSHAFDVGDGIHQVTLEARDGAGHVATFTMTFNVDTNLLSLGGPTHGLLALGLIVAVAVGGFVVLLVQLRPRRPASSPPPEPPREPPAA